MANDEIRTRITADADEAVRETQRAAEATGELGDRTRQTGEQAEEAGDKTQQAGGKVRDAGEKSEQAGMSVRSLGASIRGMAQSWLGFAAIAGTVVAALRRIANAAREALNEIVKLGGELRGLAANLGGQRADQVIGDINRVALEEGLDVAGRNELIAAVTAATDADPTLTDEQLGQRARGFARLRQASGVGGDTAQDLIQQFMATQGLGFDEAVDRSAMLLNQGVEAGTLRQLLERGVEPGGDRVLGLLMAARTEMDLRRGGRRVESMIQQLDRRDESGALHEDLQAVGISDEMDFVDRIAHLGHLEATGALSEGQVNQLIGGARRRGVFQGLMRAMPRVEEGMAALEGASVAGELAAVRESEIVGIAERQANRELRRQLAKEGFGQGAGAAEFVDERMTRFAEDGAGDEVLGVGRRMLEPGGGTRTAFELARDLARGASRAAGGGDGVNVNVTNVGQQYNRMDPAEAPPGGGSSDF